jgi:HTH-type transcriptional regulator/antitoxin HipB
MNLMTRSPKEIGAALRRIRLERNMTQSEVAEKAGLRQAVISNIENGHEGTKITTLYAVLAALNLEFMLRPRTRQTKEVW